MAKPDVDFAQYVLENAHISIVFLGHLSFLPACAAILDFKNGHGSSLGFSHRIRITYRRATQLYNVSTIFYAKLCSLLARRRSSQPVQRAYWPENVIDWLGKWRPTCVMRYACGHKLQRFRLKISFWSHRYSVLQYRSRRSMSSISMGTLHGPTALPVFTPIISLSISYEVVVYV